ncbi:hypothetical protein [Chitinophaga sancti]|uniref:hypothetical protein n=1 Tax=Chitinophaga sancti TaxID=1004 RepID=UPI003F79873E
MLTIWMIPLRTHAQSNCGICDSLRVAPLRPEAMTVLATIKNDTSSVVQKAEAYYKTDYGLAPYIP